MPKIKKDGRPLIHPDQDAAMDTYANRLSAKQARRARKIGKGNMSDGVRTAIDHTFEDEEFMKKIEEK